MFFFLILEIWFRNDIGPVFQPGESDFGVKISKSGFPKGVKGQIKSNFQNPNFSILIADLDFLQKIIIAKCPSFILILKSRNQGKFRIVRTYPDFVTLNLNLTVFRSECKKKKSTLLIYFFAGNPNLQSELKNSDLKNLT